MTKPSFVYVTFIATTPEKVWEALVDQEIMKRYWVDPVNGSAAHYNVSDWKPGSRWEHRRDDATQAADIVGTVVETTPFQQLVITWARPSEEEDTTKHSRVTFKIEPYGEKIVRLTVLHEDLEKDPKMLAGVSSGWPIILSNLKTLLETSQPLSR